MVRQITRKKLNKKNFDMAMAMYNRPQIRGLPDLKEHWAWPQWADGREFSLVEFRKNKHGVAPVQIKTVWPLTRDADAGVSEKDQDIVRLTPGHLMKLKIKNAADLLQKVQDPFFVDNLFASDKPCKLTPKRINKIRIQTLLQPPCFV